MKNILKTEVLDAIFMILGILLICKGFFYSHSEFDSLLGYIVFMSSLILMRIQKAFNTITKGTIELDD